MIHFAKSLSLATAVTGALSLCGVAIAQSSDPPLGHVSEGGTPWAQIETPEQAVVFANAQNLVARWNNIIIFTETGEEQLELMRESGVFADDVSLQFNLPDGSILGYSDLSEGPREFYNSFVNGLKKNRFNTATSVEVLEFLHNGLRFRFRHAIFMDDKFSLGGHNEVVMRFVDGRFVVTAATIHVRHFDIDHAY